MKENKIKMKKYKPKMNSMIKYNRKYSREIKTETIEKEKLQSEMTKIIRGRYFKIRKKKMKLA